MKKNRICLILAGLVFHFLLQGQNGFVTLFDNGPSIGSEFRLNGQRWFSVMANYEIAVVYNENNPSEGYFIAPSIRYGTNPEPHIDCGGAFVFESPTKASSLQQIRNDFMMLVAQGFNTVRICGELEFGRAEKNNKPALAANATGCVCCPTLKITEELDEDYVNIFNLIQMVLDAAETAGLRVQFHTGWNSASSPLDNPTFSNTYYVPYLQALAAHFSNNPTLFSYDLRNEPAGSGAKGAICNLISSWHNAIDQNCPQLTTIGFQTINPGLDVRTWDPGFAKLDFISYHIYSNLGPNAGLQNILNNVKSIIKWCSKQNTRPWMIGEVSFPANDGPTNIQTPNNQGTEADQAIFAEETLAAVRDWGGIGYGWWVFQDRQVEPNFGLYGWNQNPKAVLAKFQAFSATPSNIAISTPTNYYNIYNSGPNSVTGTIVDQNGNPIENAVISANTTIGTNAFTFSKTNGTFNLMCNTTITDITATAIRAKTNGPIFISGSGPFTIVLQLWQPTSSIYLDNTSLGNVNPLLTFYESDDLITVGSVSPLSGNPLRNIKAGVKIDIKDGFFASAGSNYHFYIAPMYADCNTVGNTYSRLPSTGNSSAVDSTILLQEDSDPISNNEIHYSNQVNDTLPKQKIEKNYDDTVNSIVLYPNPGNDFLNIKISNSDYNTIVSCEIIDNLGRSWLITKSKRLNILELSKGFYQLKFKFENGSAIVKTFVKQ